MILRNLEFDFNERLKAVFIWKISKLEIVLVLKTYIYIYYYAW